VGKLFGTDGIRGRANGSIMNGEIAFRIGLAMGYYLRSQNLGYSPRVLLGKDTRNSSYALESSLAGGLLSAGADVFSLGSIPTPAVSFLTRQMRCSMGIMISASHNYYYDNGIKFFNHLGRKFSIKEEEFFEDLILNKDPSDLYCEGDHLGSHKRIDDASGRYIEHLKARFPKDYNLNGMKIVIDGANGAAYRIAGDIFWELGADVIRINCQPNGFNINKDSGSIHPEGLAAKVVETGSHLGIGLDGDADRVVIVDELGHLIKGDQIIAAIANSMRRNGSLSRPAVVTTVMSNGGLDSYLADIGLDLIRTDVGDRNVFEEMINSNINLGGENSGHIIFSDYSSTGDGLMSALQITAILVKDRIVASKALRMFGELPQINREIKYDGVLSGEIKQTINSKSQKIVDEASKTGIRAVIRPSGTEPKIRIMTEAKGKKTAEVIADRVMEVVEKILKKSGNL
jgi:phosphoglucosamine mutase